MIKQKKANLVYQMIIHLILIALIFLLFFGAAAQRVNSRDVKQQVLEKQLALMIDSSFPGVVLDVSKINRNGIVNNIEIKDGKVFAYVGGIAFSKGYPYFTQYSVSISQDQAKFYIKIT